MRRTVTAVFAAAAVLAVAFDGRSHVQLGAPAQRTDSQKFGPCGTLANERGANVTVFEPGATILVTWTETVKHPGHFRIAFDDDGTDDLIDPATHDDLDNAPSVLVDGIPQVPGAAPTAYEQEITLPDLECDNCTLQLIQVMTDKAVGDHLYWQCADLVLGAGGPGATTGASTTASTTSSGSSTAASSGAGNTSGGGGAPDGPGSVGPGGSDGGEGGGCSTTPGPSAPGSAALLGLVALLASRRTRRRAG